MNPAAAAGVASFDAAIYAQDYTSVLGPGSPAYDEAMRVAWEEALAAYKQRQMWTGVAVGAIVGTAAGMLFRAMLLPAGGGAPAQ
jgi:hypothetical protein